MKDDIERVREVLEDMEHSLDKMSAENYSLPELAAIRKDINKQGFIIKGMIVLLAAVFFGGSFGGLVTWYHFQQDIVRHGRDCKLHQCDP